MTLIEFSAFRKLFSSLSRLLFSLTRLLSPPELKGILTAELAPLLVSLGAGRRRYLLLIGIGVANKRTTKPIKMIESNCIIDFGNGTKSKNENGGVIDL